MLRSVQQLVQLQPSFELVGPLVDGAVAAEHAEAVAAGGKEMHFGWDAVFDARRVVTQAVFDWNSLVIASVNQERGAC